MQFDRLETNTARRRLPVELGDQRGSSLGLPVWVVFLISGLLLGVGIGGILVGTGVSQVSMFGIQGPLWVLTGVGGLFAVAGVIACGAGLLKVAADRRRRELARRHPDEPVFADYPWNPRGFESQRWRQAMRGLNLGAVVALTLFFPWFTWWTFARGEWWLAKAMVILFDLVLVVCWTKCAVQAARAMKFGSSRIEFTQFPYRISEPVVIRWRAASGIERARKGSFTLRCVEEWWVRSPSVRSRGSQSPDKLVHEEICSATWWFDQPRTFPLGSDVTLRFEPLPGAFPTHLSADQYIVEVRESGLTRVGAVSMRVLGRPVPLRARLSADKPVFWEFEVDLDLPGFDFKETYLVPVYGDR